MYYELFKQISFQHKEVLLRLKYLGQIQSRFNIQTNIFAQNFWGEHYSPHSGIKSCLWSS